jgi:hypothetical protein
MSTVTIEQEATASILAKDPSFSLSQDPRGNHCEAAHNGQPSKHVWLHNTERFSEKYASLQNPRSDGRAMVAHASTKVMVFTDVGESGLSQLLLENTE